MEEKKAGKISSIVFIILQINTWQRKYILRKKLSFLAKVNRGDLTLFSKPFKRAKLLEVTLSQGISTEFHKVFHENFPVLL